MANIQKMEWKKTKAKTKKPITKKQSSRRAAAAGALQLFASFNALARHGAPGAPAWVLHVAFFTRLVAVARQLERAHGGVVKIGFLTCRGDEEQQSVRHTCPGAASLHTQHATRKGLAVLARHCTAVVHRAVDPALLA